MKKNYYFNIGLMTIAFLAGNSEYRAQNTQIRGFADVGFVSDENLNSDFVSGQYVTYITSQLNENISFLGESVFEYDEGWLVDVERILVTYDFSDAFQIKAGKAHTPIGYWNNAYHHGALIQPTIQRPLAVRFEDEGGILPIHTTGLWLAGKGISKLNLSYDFMVGNGIGSEPTSDNNQEKSITANLKIEPIDGLKIGGSAYYDYVTQGTTSLVSTGVDSIDVLGLTSNMTQMLFNGYLAYKSDKLQFVGEYFHITNDFSNGVSNQSDAYFAYLGYTLKDKITPFLKYDFISFGNGDSYFGNDDKSMISVGMRYEFSFLSNIKFEYQYLDTKNSNPTQAFALSWAVGF